jgi:general secretion pathway protein B
MSFILDALKKAESERHRDSGPVLVDVRIAPPRRRLPAWAWLLGSVLLANLLVLVWLTLREPATPQLAAAAPLAPQAQPAPTRAEAVAETPSAPTPHVIPEPRYIPPPPSPTPPAPAPAPTTRAARPADSSLLPTAKELRAAGASLPPLAMSLHVYDSSPEQRYVLLNGRQLGEGESTPDGIKVESITERGAVLEAGGRRFLLQMGE